MNKRSRTFSTWLVVVFMLLLTFIPHHHHEGGAACWVMEVCHNDGRVNDEHTAHGHADNHQHWCYWQKQSVTNASSAEALGQGGGWFFLPFAFWSSGTDLIIYRQIGKRLFAACPSFFVCSLSKHVLRRGPPIAC